jgi:hypothetical protein
VVIRKKKPTSATLKDESAVNAVSCMAVMAWLLLLLHPPPPHLQADLLCHPCRRAVLVWVLKL